MDPISAIHSYPNLGVLYLAAYLEKHEHSVKIIDLRFNRYPAFPKADFYGLASSTPEISFCKHLNKYLKSRFSGKTIIGGSHPSHLPFYCKDFDYVVIGEGEKALVDIVENDDGEKFKEYDNIKDLDSLPFPARHLLPQEQVFSEHLFAGFRYGKAPLATTLITSRGCPYNCSYCANIPKSYRLRSVENIIAEICLLKSVCNHFKFLDDNIVLSKKRAIELSEALAEEDIHFRCSARSDMIDDEVCQALKKAGCEEISIGVEVADDEILKLLNKNVTVDIHRNAVETIKNNDIKVKVCLMVGLPKETWKTIEANMFFFSQTKPDKWILNMFQPFPGCDIWSNPKKYGIALLTNNFARHGGQNSIIKTDVASNRDLQNHFKAMYSFLRSEVWR